MNRERIQRWSLALIALSMLPTAIQAMFWPESWFEDFPLGRGWVAAEGGVYDEHLVRDVGVLFLSLILVTVWSVWRREAMTIVAMAWLIQGLFHHTVRQLPVLRSRRSYQRGLFAAAHNDHLSHRRPDVCLSRCRQNRFLPHYRCPRCSRAAEPGVDQCRDRDLPRSDDQRG